MLTFVSRLFKGRSGEKPSQAAPDAVARASADRDSSVAFVAGQGARVYSLDAFRPLKKVPQRAA